MKPDRIMQIIGGIDADGNEMCVALDANGIIWDRIPETRWVKGPNSISGHNETVMVWVMDEMDTEPRWRTEQNNEDKE